MYGRPVRMQFVCFDTVTSCQRIANKHPDYNEILLLEVTTLNVTALF
jgi:hypothetical protein